MRGGGLKQLRAMRAYRALARGVHGGPGGCVRKFCISQVKYAYFQALCGLNLQKYMIWGATRGQLNFAS